MKLVYGVDVSIYEPRINWRTLRSQGVRFAFIRATSGTGYVDPVFKAHWEGARREGILRSAYHYLVAGLDAAQQADLFISTVGSDKGELPPTVDLEDKYNENEPNSRIIATCKTVLDRIEKAFGRRPIIYSRRTYLVPHVTKNGKAPAWAKDYPLWVAQYPFLFSANTMPNKNMPTQPEGWQDWKFWQYSETAIIDGVTDDIGRPTACDLDWFRGTEAELYAFANLQKQEPVEYIAQQGDTIQSIAGQHNVSVEELLNSNPDLVKAGSKLVIPVPTIFEPPEPVDTGTSSGAGTGSGTSTTSTRTYVVKPGDVLSAIAAKNGTTVDAIMAINPQITNPNMIFVGQVIVLP